MATLYEYYNTGDDNYTAFAGLYLRAQTFTPSTAHKITSVKLKLFRIGYPGTVYVYIQPTYANGHPYPTVLCSGTTNGNTLTTSGLGEWREITLGAGYDLEADTKYAIVVRAPNGDAENQLDWRTDFSSPTYAKGNHEYSTDNGSSWTSYTGRDSMFEEWGEPILTQYSGLSAQIGGAKQELCLVADGDGATGMGGIPKLRKGGTTYDIYLVETTDENASKIRMKTSAGVKAIRKKT